MTCPHHRHPDTCETCEVIRIHAEADARRAETLRTAVAILRGATWSRHEAVAA